jgi:hypothetical protein
MIRSTQIVAGCLVLYTCNAIGQQAPSMSEQATFLFGEVRMSTPGGQPIGTSLSLVRRVLKPAEKRIVEVVATIEPGRPVREYTAVFEVSESGFAIRDEEGTFAGTGVLTGKPWEWTGWSYEVEFTGARKGRLKGEDTLGAAGISVKKSFASPDGTVRVLFTEELKPISKAAYDILRGKLFP